MSTHAPTAAAATILPFEGDAPAPWLADLRQAGLDIYRKAGLPTRKVEAWKYTGLDGLVKTSFAPAPLSTPVDVGSLPAGEALSLDAHVVVLVNGRVDPELSDLDALPAGVRADSLALLMESEPETVTPLLGSLTALDGLPLVALNTGLMADGLVIRIAEGIEMVKPLHIVSVGAATDGPVAFHPRHLVVLDKGARATVLESHISLPGAATFSNGVMEVVVGEGAALNHYRLFNEALDAYAVAASVVDVGAGARYESFSLTLGGRLVRNEQHVTLSGEQSEAVVNGAYAVRDGQHADNTVLVDHAVPRARSNQLFKGVLDETGKGVFQGKILVRRHAQETDGQQLHKALLLSRGAEVDTKPELEIYADDVTCSHGATCGEMDEEQLFYLQARGIDEQTARALLVEAFLEDVVGAVSHEPSRDAMIAMVRHWQRARNQAVWSEA